MLSGRSVRKNIPFMFSSNAKQHDKIVLIFLLSKRFLDSIASLVVAATYAVMSLSRSVIGFSFPDEKTESKNCLLFLSGCPSLCNVIYLLKTVNLKGLSSRENRPY